MTYKTMITSAILVCVLGGTSYSADHKVQMLNKGDKGAMVFQPDLIFAAPGDTVTFVPTDKSHSAESIKGMSPEGADLFKSKMNQEITVTFKQDGAYGVKCLPHYGMGMVALIVVGTPTNIEQAKAVKQPGKAKATFEQLFAALPTQ